MKETFLFMGGGDGKRKICVQRESEERSSERVISRKGEKSKESAKKKNRV